MDEGLEGHMFVLLGQVKCGLGTETSTDLTLCPEAIVNTYQSMELIKNLLNYPLCFGS